MIKLQSVGQVGGYLKMATFIISERVVCSVIEKIFLLQLDLLREPEYIRDGAFAKLKSGNN
jgi:hypothetical protein